MDRFKKLVQAKKGEPTGRMSAFALFNDCEEHIAAGKLPPHWKWYINDLRSSLKFANNTIGRVDAKRMYAQDQAMLLRWKLEDIEQQHQWWLIYAIILASVIIAFIIR